MIKICLAVVMFALSASLARGQDSASAQSSTSIFFDDKGTMRWERMAYVTGTTVAFSLADYVAFSSFGHSAPPPYRVVQAISQLGISYLLYTVCGLRSALAFNLQSWTWDGDLAFYGWAYALNPASHGRWENRTWNGLQERQITWAGWTPIGLTRPRGAKIARSTVLAQAISGFAISIAILW